MAMNVGARRGGMLASINVTPMIDVLLVLLIIFMVVYPQLQKGLSLQVPPPDPEQETQPPESLVLDVLPGGVYRINRQPVPAGALARELASVLSGRNRKVLFVKADGRVAYREVVDAVDASRAAGATVVGLVPGAAP